MKVLKSVATMTGSCGILSVMLCAPLTRFVRSLHGWRLTFVLQRSATLGIAGLALLTFLSANLHALLWQSSEWLVSTVLPAVVVEETNERRPAAAPQLARSAVLDRAATLKAEHMAEVGYFAHYAPDGTTPWYWFDSAGYDYRHAGENLAVYFTDATAVVEAWMESPTHRAHIVDPKFTEIGVGTARGTFRGYDTVFVVQLFATPARPAGRPKPTPVAIAQVEEQPIQPEPTTTGGTPPQSSGSAPITPPPPPLAREHGDTESAARSNVPISTTSPHRATATSSAALEPTDSSQTREEPTAVVRAGPIATSASATEVPYDRALQTPQRPSVLAAAATQPSTWLSVVYTLLALTLAVTLTIAIFIEARERRWRPLIEQAALAGVLIGLWYTHIVLVGGVLVAGISRALML